MKKAILITICFIFTLTTIKSQNIVGKWTFKYNEFSLKTNDESATRDIIYYLDGNVSISRSMGIEIKNDSTFTLYGEYGKPSLYHYKVGNGFLTFNEIENRQFKYEINNDIYIHYNDMTELVKEAAKELNIDLNNLIIEEAYSKHYYTRQPDSYSFEEEALNKYEDECKDFGQAFVVVEQMPVYPEGTEGMLEFINKNLKYPEEAQKKGIEGKVILRFVVGCNGYVSDVQIMRGLDPLIDREAVRVVKLMPRWKPGKQNGRPVPVYFTLPVSFKLTRKNAAESDSTVGN